MSSICCKENKEICLSLANSNCQEKAYLLVYSYLVHLSTAKASCRLAKYE